MHKRFSAITALAVALSIGSAHAEMVKSALTASNGVTVTKNSDDFARRYEYSGPWVEAESAKGALVRAAVARIRGGDEIGPTYLRGFLIYHGDWRHFESAVFRGGSPVNFTNTDKDVGDCRGGCSLSESFTILLTAAEIADHAEGGKLAIQIRARTGDTALVEIPVADFDAVNEVAK